MAFGSKKKSGPVTITLKEDQFCERLSDEWENVKKDYCLNANADDYTLLYQSGRFKGMPAPFGGNIYPFSVDPTKEGSKKDGKEIGTSEIVVISKTTNLKIYWGTAVPFTLEDPVTKKAYAVGANGVFYVEIDGSDAARKADMFYRKVAKPRFTSEGFNAEAARDFLREAFIMEIGAKIENYINASGRSLANYVGLAPSEIKKISEELCPTIKDIFGDFGLSVVVKASSASILQDLKVTEYVR